MDNEIGFGVLIAVIVVFVAVALIGFGASWEESNKTKPLREELEVICIVVNAKATNIPPSQMDAAQKMCFKYSGVKENKK